MANDDPEDPRRRATPQIGWSQRPKEMPAASLSRSAVTPMPARLKAAQANKTTERDLPSSGARRNVSASPRDREERGDRYSDVSAGSVEVVAPPARSQPASVVSAGSLEPYDLEGPLAPHLAWLDDDGRADLLGHLKRGDHPRALAMLASASKRYPRIVSITRAIQLVERAAIARLTKRIGDFDAVAVVAGRPGPSHESITLAALIDGSRTVDEIVRISSLPRLRTLELLDDLMRRGAVEVRDPYVGSSAIPTGRHPSGDLPSARERKATPLAMRAPLSAGSFPSGAGDARPASVAPQRLSPNSAPKAASAKRETPLAAALAAAAMREIPDLDEGARVTIPGYVPDDFGMREPEPSPQPPKVTPYEDEGPSIAVETLGPPSSPREPTSVEESAREEGLPAVLAFGLLSLPVRSQSPSSPRTGRADTPLPGSAVAMTEPQPTLVTPRDPAQEKKKDPRVKMETLKSAPDPDAVRAAELADREERGAVQVVSARKRDLEQTTESPVAAPKPPSAPPPFPELPVKTPTPRPVVAREEEPSPKDKPTAFELAPMDLDPGANLRAERAGAARAVSDRPPTDRPVARALPDDRSPSSAKSPPEVRTIVRESTPRWFAPVLVLVGVALIGSAIAVYLSLRTASEPPPLQDRAANQPTPTASVTPSADASGQAASSAPAVPEPKTIRVRIDVTPRAARVTLDKVLLTAHPIDEIIPRDGKDHEIRVELAGYDTVKKSFKGDVEQNLTIVLKQIGPTVGATPPPTNPPPTNLPTAPTPQTSKPPEEPVYPTP